MIGSAVVSDTKSRPPTATGKRHLPLHGMGSNGVGPNRDASRGGGLPSRGAAARQAFLPTTRADMDARGWDQLDVLIVSGDAYVDHPAFGPVLIARFLEARGFRVGFIAQPNWT